MISLAKRRSSRQFKVPNEENFRPLLIQSLSFVMSYIRLVVTYFPLVCAQDNFEGAVWELDFFAYKQFYLYSESAESAFLTNSKG